MNIVVGSKDNGNLKIDVDVLLRTRMLVQANSGKGKSWLLRRLAEQLFGKVQVIIIDPEGEFPTLREKFDYVLVGKGGETPADIRSAVLVAHKLLEIRASAVCDLYEMKPFERHEWVKRFIDAMIDAPKNLWHPCIIIVDEAHTLAPEKGAGESVASDSMIALATRGRKRGFSPIFATQRLGKLRKDAAAELLNVMIGGTFIDIDRKRAADALGVYGSDQHKFFDEIKVLEPGMFYCIGPAMANERTLVRVGEVQTTHPQAGSTRHSMMPPPPPEKVKALLPKLADLPKEAEERQKSIDGLQKEVRELKSKLREMASRPPTLDEEKLKKEVERYERIAKKTNLEYYSRLVKAIQPIQRLCESLAAQLTTVAKFQIPDPPDAKIVIQPIPSEPILVNPNIRSSTGSTSIPAVGSVGLNDEKALGKCEIAIATFLFSNPERAWTKEQVGIMTGYSPRSGGFANSIYYLASRGFIRRDNGLLQANEKTPDGINTSLEFSINNIKDKLGKCEREIFEVLLANPDNKFTKEGLAELTPSRYSPTSGGFANSIYLLGSLGALRRQAGIIQLSDDVKELI